MSNTNLISIIEIGDTMKKTKLKVRKQVWIVLATFILIIILVNVFNNIHKNNLYKKTNEYRLMQVGYTKEEIKVLEQNTNQQFIDTLFDNHKNENIISLIQNEYYIKDNLNRYIDFLNKNNTSAQEVIASVNTNNDYNYYEHNLDTDTSLDCLMLVNKYYHLSENYEPNDLVNINNKYYYGTGHKVRKPAYEAFIDLWNAANQEGIYLIINSSYRDYASQSSVYDSFKNQKGTTYADSIAARPGYSEHQTGLAIDIFSKENTTSNNFKGSTAHIWLQNNAYKYGFIERYQEGKEKITGFEAESWHWRYVGVETATYIYNHNITFDEYYAYFIAK